MLPGRVRGGRKRLPVERSSMGWEYEALFDVELNYQRASWVLMNWRQEVTQIHVTGGRK